MQQNQEFLILCLIRINRDFKLFAARSKTHYSRVWFLCQLRKKPEQMDNTKEDVQVIWLRFEIALLDVTRQKGCASSWFHSSKQIAQQNTETVLKLTLAHSISELVPATPDSQAFLASLSTLWLSHAVVQGVSWPSSQPDTLQLVCSVQMLTLQVSSNMRRAGTSLSLCYVLLHFILDLLL